jgi:hypothetical protein
MSVTISDNCLLESTMFINYTPIFSKVIELRELKQEQDKTSLTKCTLI